MEKRNFIIIAILMLVASACSTGKKLLVSDDEVVRVLNETGTAQSTLTPFSDSVAAWKQGKQFAVVDDQVRHLFTPTNEILSDTSHLAGHYLRYDGYDTGSVLDNRPTVNIRFVDDAGHTYVYPTGKTIDALGGDYTIPLLIDMDMVESVRQQLVGRDVYIRTSIWYDPATLNMVAGRKFIKVHITGVEPGNKVLPLRVLFTASDDGTGAMLWMSAGKHTMRNRDFDALFSTTDLRLQYPSISDATWDRIVHGQVVADMTKDECRLALGQPKRISQRPDQSALSEYWYYDGGTYLYFVDGLLRNYRK